MELRVNSFVTFFISSFAVLCADLLLLLLMLWTIEELDELLHTFGPLVNRIQLKFIGIFDEFQSFEYIALFIPYNSTKRKYFRFNVNVELSFQ